MKSITLLRGLVAVVGLVLSFSGAAAETPADDTNPYANGYEKRLDAPAAKPAVGNVKIFRGNDRDVDYGRLLEDGYDLLGASSFKSGDVPPDLAVAHAKNIKADLVMVYSTRFGQIPKAVQIDAAKARAKAGNSDIDANLPEMRLVGGMEYSYEYYATFWIKLPPPALGLHVQDRIADDKRAGVPIIAVIKGSPAAKADIRKGDVVLKIADQEVKNGDALVDAVRRNVGKTVDVTWLRDDILMEKPVTLNTP